MLQLLSRYVLESQKRSRRSNIAYTYHDIPLNKSELSNDDALDRKILTTKCLFVLLVIGCKVGLIVISCDEAIVFLHHDF